MDEFGLAKTVDRFGQSVVLAVANAADRRRDPGLGKAFCILDREVLAAAVAVVDQATMMNWPPVVDRLFEGIQHEAGMRPDARQCGQPGNAVRAASLAVIQ